MNLRDVEWRVLPVGLCVAAMMGWGLQTWWGALLGALLVAFAAAVGSRA